MENRSMKNYRETNEFREQLERYLHIVSLNKLWVIVITSIFTVLWILIFALFIEKETNYPTSTLIRFGDPRSRTPVGAMRDFSSMSNESKVAVLHSNVFLGKVVDSLKLNVEIETRKVRRLELIKKIDLAPNVEYGQYQLQMLEPKLNMYYTNKQKDIKHKLITSSRISNDSLIVISGNGLTLTLDKSVFNKYNPINLNCVPKRVAVEKLKGAIETRIDESRTLLTIIYTHKDPYFSAYVSNKISAAFLDQLLEYNRYQTSSVIKSLEEQLEVARTELKISEDAVRQFRENNPLVFLANDGQQIASNLASYETNRGNYNRVSAELQALLDKKAQIGTGGNIHYYYQELLSFLISQNVAAATPYGAEFDQVSNELQRLRNQNYSDDHPQVINLNNQLRGVEEEIEKSARTYQISLQNNLNDAQQNIVSFQSNLRRLPRNQLQLAELERDRQIKENIVSSILMRYNEAKVTDASVISEAFLIDDAQPPLIYVGFFDKLPFYLMGLVIGLVLAVGIFVGADFMSDRVKSITSVETNINVPVLGTIPVIGDEKEVPGVKDLEKELDTKLITSDYAPNIAGEKFRLLRTKLSMESGSTKKSLLITSLRPGEGKALVAANLAITFAQQKLPTLLIDADLRRGVLHNSFNLKKRPGLAEILVMNNPIDRSELVSKAQNTHIPNLYLMASGMQIPNPSELLGSQRMKNFIDIAESQYGMIIIDTPPMEFIPDALVLNNLVHNILLIVRYGKTHLQKLREKIFEYSKIRSDFQGVIINAYEELRKKDHYSYSYYHY